MTSEKTGNSVIEQWIRSRGPGHQAAIREAQSHSARLNEYVRRNNPVVDQSQIVGSQQVASASPPLQSDGPNSGFDSRDGGHA